MVDGTLDAGGRGADVELRSRAARGSHSLARRPLTAAFGEQASGHLPGDNVVPEKV
jgi:hypothetical protein